MAAYVDPSRAGPVIELGPGTGPVTEALLAKGIDSSRLVLVEFDPEAHVGLFTFVEVLDFLADVLGTRIDLATPGALRQEMRERILSEAIRAF